MPSYDISFDTAIQSLQAHPREKTLTDYSTIVSTAQGLTLIEIQGDLSLPKDKPTALSDKEKQLFDKIAIPPLLSDSQEQVDMVNFGRLEIDESFKKATLFISTTQRLIGTVEKIDPPLGILKVSTNETDSTDKTCQMIDVLKTKIIFKNRPLPIM